MELEEVEPCRAAVVFVAVSDMSGRFVLSVRGLVASLTTMRIRARVARIYMIRILSLSMDDEDHG